MRFAEFEELNTSNLILRKFRMDDMETFYIRVGGNKNVTKYMLWEPHESAEESFKSIQKVLRRYEEGNTYTWAIALKGDDSIIGRIDLLRLDEATESCSFAYMISDAYWGRGFGTEALSVVLEFAFEKMEMQVILADHMCENGASGAVMRKVGMTYVQTYKAKYEKLGNVFDADEYKITCDEWRNLC